MRAGTAYARRQHVSTVPGGTAQRRRGPALWAPRSSFYMGTNVNAPTAPGQAPDDQAPGALQRRVTAEPPRASATNARLSPSRPSLSRPAPSRRPGGARAKSHYVPKYPLPAPGTYDVPTPVTDRMVRSCRQDELFTTSDEALAAQDELLRSCQVARYWRQELAAGTVPSSDVAKATAQLAAAERHTSLLAQAAHRYMWGVFHKRARQVYAGPRSEQLEQDISSAMNMAFMEAALSFDPSLGIKFKSHLRAAVVLSIRDVFIGTSRSISGVPSSAEVAARLARTKVLPALEERLGRQPTNEEITQALIEAKVNAEPHSDDCGPNCKPGEVHEGRCVSSAMAKLKRSGFLHAVTIDLVRTLSLLGRDMSLDAGEHSLVDQLPSGAVTENADANDAVESLLAGMCSGSTTSHDRELLTKTLELFLDNNEAKQNWRALAGPTGMNWTDVRATIETLRARAIAPHFQFAIFCPAQEGLFEEEPPRHPERTGQDIADLVARKVAARATRPGSGRSQASTDVPREPTAERTPVRAATRTAPRALGDLGAALSVSTYRKKRSSTNQ